MKSLSILLLSATFTFAFASSVIGCSNNDVNDGDDQTEPESAEGELRKRPGSEKPAASTIWPADREMLVMWSAGGGFLPPAPEGSTCTQSAFQYSVTIATRELESMRCVQDAEDKPFHPLSKKRTLSAAEMKKIDTAVAEMKKTTIDFCGADKPFLEVTVASPSQGLMTYTDSFYACMGGDDRIYLDNMDTVLDVLGKLAAQ